MSFLCPYGVLTVSLRPTQVHSEAVKYGQSLGCRAAVVYGGVPKHTQVAALAPTLPLTPTPTPTPTLTLALALDQDLALTPALAQTLTQT